MHFEDAILPSLSFIAVFLAFLDSLKKGVNGYKIGVIILGLLIMGFSIYLEMGKSEKIDTLISGNDSLNQKVERLSTQRGFDSLAIDNSDKITRRKIDSAKNSITDSLRTTSSFTITTLQKTIREQAKELDSLGRVHAEKHLTNSDKKNILRRVNMKMKEMNQSTKEIGITMMANSNGSAFSEELKTFLKENGYKIAYSGMSPQTDLQGYDIGFSMGKVDIVIGVFKL